MVSTDTAQTHRSDRIIVGDAGDSLAFGGGLRATATPGIAAVSAARCSHCEASTTAGEAGPTARETIAAADRATCATADDVRVKAGGNCRAGG